MATAESSDLDPLTRQTKLARSILVPFEGWAPSTDAVQCQPVSREEKLKVIIANIKKHNDVILSQLQSLPPPPTVQTEIDPSQLPLEQTEKEDRVDSINQSLKKSLEAPSDPIKELLPLQPLPSLATVPLERTALHPAEPLIQAFRGTEAFQADAKRSLAKYEGYLTKKASSVPRIDAVVAGPLADRRGSFSIGPHSAQHSSMPPPKPAAPTAPMYSTTSSTSTFAMRPFPTNVPTAPKADRRPSLGHSPASPQVQSPAENQGTYDRSRDPRLVRRQSGLGR